MHKPYYIYCQWFFVLILFFFGCNFLFFLLSFHFFIQDQIKVGFLISDEEKHRTHLSMSDKYTVAIFFICLSWYTILHQFHIYNSASTVTHIIKSSLLLVWLLSFNIGRCYRIFVFSMPFYYPCDQLVLGLRIFVGFYPPHFPQLPTPTPPQW